MGRDREVRKLDTFPGMKRWFWVLDVLVVVSFVVIGADTHGFTFQVADVLRVAAPFLIALAVGIIALRAWKKPLSLLNGILLAVIALTVGMLLRRYVWDDGTPRMFIIVTGGYFLGLMIGWRLIGLAIRWLRNR